VLRVSVQTLAPGFEEMLLNSSMAILASEGSLIQDEAYEAYDHIRRNGRRWQLLDGWPDFPYHLCNRMIPSPDAALAANGPQRMRRTGKKRNAW
jgi:hypothetical protein